MKPTAKQIAYVATLRKRVNMSTDALDVYVYDTFRLTFANLTRNQVSTLIEQMETWEAIPVVVQRALGQLDMFEGKPL